VYVADPYTYEVLYANKAMKEKFGGELVGGICYREFQRKESPCNFCTNPIILKERSKPYNWEYYNPMVDRFFIIMDRIIRWPDGRDVRLEIAKDITERRKTEEALKKAHENLEEKVKERTVELEEAYSSLKKSEGRLAEAQRIAHLGNWDWNTVTNELYWSDEVYRIFGCSPQEFGATYDAFLSYVHPDDLEYVNNAVIEALNGKSYRIDHRIILANGEERMIHEQGEVIFDEKNTPVRMVGTVQDITEHKKAAEKIQMLADVVESSNDTIVTRTLDGIVTSWNKGAEQMHGYSADEIIGKKITIMEPDDRKGELFRLAEKVKHGEKIKNYETVRLKKDGTRLNVSITLSPVFDSSGKLIAISTIARDITDRIKAEEALSKTEEARRKEIHHRIKNNLQVISSLLDLQAEKFRDKEVLEAFRESQSRVISMSLIHEELYKGEGTDKLDFSAYLQMLAKNLFHTYDLGSKNIRLYMDLAENAFFNMDIAVPLGIIVNELISNSLKHAFKGRDKGEIRIRLHRENVEECKIDGHKNTNFTLTVSDDGIGISENLDIKSIDSLGLQLVISLVEQLDGSLELKRNHGTEFIIRFTVRGNDDQELMPAVQRSIE
jgi:PAS domain S-box-containing protein